MADICDHNVGLAFEMHIDMALANDVPLVDIREVIFHAAPEAGYTNALQALVRFKEVVKEKQLQEFKDDEAATGGGIPNDPKLHERLESLAHGFGETWAVAVEQQWQRCHLSIKERALLSIAADVSNQTLGEPFAYGGSEGQHYRAPHSFHRPSTRGVGIYELLHPQTGQTAALTEDPDMRDLRTYPITVAEIVACLLRLAEEVASEGQRGDPRALLLREAAKIVAASERIN